MRRPFDVEEVGAAIIRLAATVARFFAACESFPTTERGIDDMTTGFTNFDRALLYRILANQEDQAGETTDQKLALAAISAKIDAIIQQETTLAADLSQLQTDVSSNSTVIGSAETLLQGLATQLATAIAALPDPAQLNALQAQIESDDAGLAAAVAANTPAAPTGP